MPAHKSSGCLNEPLWLRLVTIGWHQVENSGLRKLLKLKEREHSRIKKLAHDIISQRTEVEQFFLESLEQVRDEIVRERKERDATFITSESSTHFNSRLPHIRSNLPCFTPAMRLSCLIGKTCKLPLLASSE